MSKAAVADLLVKANAFAPFRFLNRQKLLVLMYHRFSNSEELGKTSIKTFEAHLAYLTRHYKVISIVEAVRRLCDGKTLPPRSAVITIDDGYRDFHEVAFPVLERFALPATLYVVTDFVNGRCWIWTDIARFIMLNTKKDRLVYEIAGRSIDHSLDGRESRFVAAGTINAELKKLPDERKDQMLADLAKVMNVNVPELPPEEFGPLNWVDTREMEQKGISIGSHTATHPILTNVSEERLVTELERSRKTIEEKLQKGEVHFCYPNGNVAKRERDAVKAAGYASAVTTEIRLCENIEDKFLIPRIDAEPELNRFVQATSGFDKFKSGGR